MTTIDEAGDMGSNTDCLASNLVHRLTGTANINCTAVAHGMLCECYVMVMIDEVFA